MTEYTIMRILLAEDNIGISKAISKNLKSHYSIDSYLDGQQALDAAEITDYDVLLLDLNLPKLSGEEICKQLRKQKFDTPIIVISGKSEVKDKISLLDMGADDYIVKPFNLEELRARIDSAIRTKNRSVVTSVMRIADLELDSASRKVFRSDQEIILRRKEFDLLEYLMRNQGQALSRSMIIEHIWDMNENIWANAIDVHIKHLRDKVDRKYDIKLIKTVRGIGYRID